MATKSQSLWLIWMLAGAADALSIRGQGNSGGHRVTVEDLGRAGDDVGGGSGSQDRPIAATRPPASTAASDGGQDGPTAATRPRARASTPENDGDAPLTAEQQKLRASLSAALARSLEKGRVSPSDFEMKPQLTVEIRGPPEQGPITDVDDRGDRPSLVEPTSEGVVVEFTSDGAKSLVEGKTVAELLDPDTLSSDEDGSNEDGSRSGSGTRRVSRTNSYTSLDPELDAELSDYSQARSSDDDTDSQYDYPIGVGRQRSRRPPRRENNEQGWLSYLLFGGWVPTCGRPRTDPGSAGYQQFPDDFELTPNGMYDQQLGSGSYSNEGGRDSHASGMEIRQRRRSLAQPVNPESWWHWRMPEITCGNTREDRAAIRVNGPPGPGQEDYDGEVDDLLEAFLDEPDRLPTEAGKKCHCCYQWDTFREAPQWVYKKIPAKIREHMPHPWVCQLCYDKFAAKDPNPSRINLLDGDAVTATSSEDEAAPAHAPSRPKLIRKECCMCEKDYDLDQAKYGVWLCVQCTLKADLMPDFKAQVIAKKVANGGSFLHLN